ncbi:MAG TPA: hypothetical protein VIJ62_10145 [Rhizomicrobium sp.]
MNAPHLNHEQNLKTVESRLVWHEVVLGLLVAAIFLLMVLASRSSPGFTKLSESWGVWSFGAACFCLGLGGAYLIFARYRDQQAKRLEDAYGDLHERAQTSLAIHMPGSEQ